MAYHFLYREVGFLDEPECRFRCIVVGRETTLEFDLAPHEFVHEHRCYRSVAGQPSQYQGGLPVQTIHGCEYRLGIARDVHDHIAHLAVRFFANDVNHVFFFHVDGAMSAKFLCQFQSRLVASDPGDKNLGSAGVACGKSAGEPLLSGALN